MNRMRALFAVLAGLLLITLLQSCADQESGELTLPEGKTAEVVFVVGDVYLSRSGDGWIKAQIGDILKEGTRIRTDGDSYIELVIGSGTIFRMKDRSELQLVLLPESKKENKSKIMLETGDLFAKVKRIAYSSEDTIATSSMTLGVRGTEFLVHADNSPGGAFSEVLVKGGVVNARLNAEAPDTARRNPDLAPVLERLHKGVKVKGGYKLAVSAEQIERLSGGIRELAAQGKAEEPTIAALKQEAAPKSVPLGPGDRERLADLDKMSLRYARGETVFVSPNFDGTNDELELDTSRWDFGKARGWKLVATDGAARVQKVIGGGGENGGAPAGLPQKIGWNMVSEGGQVVPDGNYVYEIYTLEKGGKDRLRVRGIIVVDTVLPALEILPQDMTFSPNGDGVKDIIAFTLQAENDIEWSCVINAFDGIVVKTYDWGSDIPLVFEWNGLGEDGNALPDGLYDVTVSGTDRAGNKTVETVHEVALDTRGRGATVAVNRQVFSPNGDGIADAVIFTPYLSDRNRVDTWDLIVQTEKGETARRFRGQGAPPESIEWDGAPEKGKSFEYLPKQLPSGTYFYFLKVVYRSGVNTFSFKKELVLDNDPPRIAVGVSPELFSPDGDGENDLLFIVPTITDVTPLSSWKAVIYTSRGMVFKTFSGSGQIGESITWDGVSDRGIRVGSAEDYYLQFDATDSGSNTGTSPKLPFSIDILVIPSSRGLKIQVSNIEFAFNAAELKGDRTFAVLKRVVEVLKKYKKYSITIEGHTDSTGDAAYNVDLSKKRAEAVGKYLIKNGIEPDRLSYEGYGSKYPVDTNDTVDGRARNRRVEFLLQKRR
jgi:outer membrane protein OmpA-like peptidoglycan-associated protein